MCFWPCCGNLVGIYRASGTSLHRLTYPALTLRSSEDPPSVSVVDVVAHQGKFYSAAISTLTLDLMQVQRRNSKLEVDWEYNSTQPNRPSAIAVDPDGKPCIAGLKYGTATVSRIIGGGGGSNPRDEIQQIQLSGDPQFGTFDLAGVPVSPLATAAEVQTALEAVYGAGNVSCSLGPLPDAVRVTWMGSLSHTSIPLMTVSQDVQYNLSGFDEDGNLIWQHLVDDGELSALRDVVIDKNGNFYVSTQADQVYKLNASRGQEWSFDVGVQIGKLAVDPDGYLYVPSGEGVTGTVKKLDPSGNEVWSYSHARPVLACAVDSHGNVYGAAQGGSGGNAFKLDPDGNQIWSTATRTNGDGSTGGSTAVVVAHSGKSPVFNHVTGGLTGNGLVRLDTETGEQQKFFSDFTQSQYRELALAPGLLGVSE